MWLFEEGSGLCRFMCMPHLQLRLIFNIKQDKGAHPHPPRSNPQPAIRSLLHLLLLAFASCGCRSWLAGMPASASGHITSRLGAVLVSRLCFAQGQVGLYCQYSDLSPRAENINIRVLTTRPHMLCDSGSLILIWQCIVTHRHRHRHGHRLHFHATQTRW